MKLHAEGYENAESDWLPVLPVQTDVNIKMTSKLPSEIKSAQYNSNSSTIVFTKHMIDESITDKSLYLTDSDGNIIPSSVKPVKENGNDTDSSMRFTITPLKSTDLSGASVNLTSDALSYAGIASVNSVIALAL